jgi:hypothetical protein
MDESPSGCWTNQHSIIEFKHQWYLFSHHNDLSPHFDKNRSVRIDSLFFNEDGTIKNVIPTFRGVGVTDASRKIEIDRYSLIMSPVVRATTKGMLALDAIFLFRGRTFMNQPKGLRVGLDRLLGT